MSRPITRKFRLAMVALLTVVSTTSCVVPGYRLFLGLTYTTCDFYVLEPVPASYRESVIVPGIISMGCYDG